jgi:two-component system, NarL family, response regulator DevR
MPGYVSSLVRVYLLDDHDIVRRGLRDLLAAARDIQVVGDSSSTRDAAQAILELETTVMVLDLQLQDGTGIEVCRDVRAVDPSVRGLLLTSYGEDEALTAALLAGASGYIVKSSRGADIIGAVRRLGEGRTMIEPALAEAAIRRLTSQVTGPALTDRERVLLDLVLQGRTNGEIADHLDAEPGRVGAEIAGLIGRVRSTSAGPDHERGTEPPGRHRRA